MTYTVLHMTTIEEVSSTISNHIYGQNPVLGEMLKYNNYTEFQEAISNQNNYGNVTLSDLVEQINSVKEIARKTSLNVKIPKEFSNLKEEINSSRKNPQNLYKKVKRYYLKIIEEICPNYNLQCDIFAS